MVPLKDVSQYGYLVENVINISVGGGIIIGIISFAIAIYIVVRFRRSKNPQPLKEIPGWLRKVIYIDVVMIVFDLLLMVISTYGWVNLFVRDPEEIKRQILSEGKPYVEVKVTGRQFFWTFTYPGKDGKFQTNDDFKLANVLVVPEGSYVFLDMSAGDVIHSFFVPNVRMKYDTIPSRSTYIWFQVLEKGEYEVACAELCGALHYKMRAIVKVLPKEEYEKWLSSWWDYKL